MLRRFIFSLAIASMLASFGASAAIAPATAVKPAHVKATVSATTATPVVAATPAKPAKAVTRCRNAKGKFITCPKTEAAKAKPVRCRDSMGKFISCAK